MKRLGNIKDRYNAIKTKNILVYNIPILPIKTNKTVIKNIIANDDKNINLSSFLNMPNILDKKYTAIKAYIAIEQFMLFKSSLSL